MLFKIHFAEIFNHFHSANTEVIIFQALCFEQCAVSKFPSQTPLLKFIHVDLETEMFIVPIDAYEDLNIVKVSYFEQKSPPLHLSQKKSVGSGKLGWRYALIFPCCLLLLSCHASPSLLFMLFLLLLFCPHALTANNTLPCFSVQCIAGSFRLHCR